MRYGPLAVIVPVEGNVFFVGHFTAEAHQFHFDSKEPDKQVHAGHAAFFIEMPAAQTDRLMGTWVEGAFDFQKDASGLIVTAKHLENFGADAASPVFWIYCQIVEKNMVITVESDGKSTRYL